MIKSQIFSAHWKSAFDKTSDKEVARYCEISKSQPRQFILLIIYAMMVIMHPFVTPNPPLRLKTFQIFIYFYQFFIHLLQIFIYFTLPLTNFFILILNLSWHPKYFFLFIQVNIFFRWFSYFILFQFLIISLLASL